MQQVSQPARRVQRLSTRCFVFENELLHAYVRPPLSLTPLARPELRSINEASIWISEGLTQADS